MCCGWGGELQTEKTCANAERPRQEIDSRDRSEWMDSEAVEKAGLAGTGD